MTATEPPKRTRKRPRKPPANGPKRGAGAEDKTGRAGRKDTAGGTSPWEWAVAAVGAAILVSIVGYLIYESIARPPEARPEIVVNSKPAVSLWNGAFLVPIEVRNRGHVTGAGVNVSGALVGPDGAVVEESAVTFGFIAQHSKETGGLFFAADPRTLRLVLRVEGYTDP
jgi:uncharacterized protein (TIGR02588 family)